MRLSQGVARGAKLWGRGAARPRRRFASRPLGLRMETGEETWRVNHPSPRPLPQLEEASSPQRCSESPRAPRMARASCPMSTGFSTKALMPRVLASSSEISSL